MIENIQETIQSLAQKRSDERLNVFKVGIKSLENNKLTLSGQVLEKQDVDELLEVITKRFGFLQIDASGVEVLRKQSNQTLSVGTNLTSAHASTSFLSEMSSQMVYGEKVEILAEQARWAYTRQSDGYLAWTYKPYLTNFMEPIATHIVVNPAINLYEKPDENAAIMTRIFCGTSVAILNNSGDWAQVSANITGWTRIANLRAFTDIPTTNKARRSQIFIDAQKMIGVPYLWGGTSGNGIDCSGFARLLHRWVGVEIPRDADLQSTRCKRVEPPFQPGDLFFFGEGDSDRRITHVGVSMGGWNMLHSSRSRNGVYMDDIQEKESLRSIFAHAGTFLNE